MGYCWAYLHYSWSSDSLFNARHHREPYIARAKACLQNSMLQDASDANRVNCLFALASLCGNSPWRTFDYDSRTDKDVSVYHPESEQAQFFAQLYQLRFSPEFILQNLSHCDNLKSYIDHQK